MKSNDKNPYHYAHTIQFILLFFILCTFQVSIACAVPYTLKSIWPQSDQLYFFNEPRYLSMDENNCVYVSDQWNHQIKKYTSDGRFILSFGEQGTDYGQFQRPAGIAFYKNSIYVVDSENNRIQIFSTNGDFIMHWGSYGSTDGCFDSPQHIAINENGQVFITDPGNYRIQQFSPSGTFVRQWGKSGENPGEFKYPLGIAVDRYGYIYVTDPAAFQIQKFEIDPDSSQVLWKETIDKWGGYSLPYMISFDNQNNMYISTSANYIEKYNTNGQLQAIWGQTGNQISQFRIPWGILVGNNQTIYVADSLNDRIELFTTSGEYLSQWNSSDLIPGFFDTPEGIAIGSNNRVFVADRNNHRIQQFTSDGHFVMQWGKEGNLSGQFLYPEDIVLDSNNNVYVADIGNHRIQKFSPSGEYILSFGDWGMQNGEFENIDAINIHPSGDIWVLDHFTSWELTPDNELIIDNIHRFQVFSSDGTLSASWYNPYSNNSRITCFDFLDHQHLIILQDNNFQVLTINTLDQALSFSKVKEWVASELNSPKDIAVRDDKIFVADSGNHQIHAFADDGQYLFSVGQNGTRPGQFQSPEYICLDTMDNVYVTDKNRVQIFHQKNMSIPKKAVIISGGWPFADNILMNGINMSVNNAYQTLRNKGFADEDIVCLSGLTSSVINVKNAIYELATNDSDVVIVMIGQGNGSLFFLNAWEYISCEEMDEWLTSMSSQQVFFIADFEGSGDFIRSFSNDAIIKISRDQVNDTIVPNHENAFLFSQFFWNGIFHGETLNQAFVATQQHLSALGNIYYPTIDANGNGHINETEDFLQIQAIDIGDTVILPSRSTISQLTAMINNNGLLTVRLQVTEYTQVAHVNVHLIKEDSSYETIDINVCHLTQGEYKGTYTAIDHPGRYTITAFAIHHTGLFSFPKTIEIYNNTGHDIFENDNSAETAGTIHLNNEHQHHNFYMPGDMDWVQFNGIKDKLYTIETIHLDYRCNTAIDLFDTDGKTPLAEMDIFGIGKDEQLYWLCPESGIYYIRIRQNDPNIYGLGTRYDIRLSIAQNKTNRHITGKLIDATNHTPVSDKTIILSNSYTATTDETGRFDFLHQSIGDYTLTVICESYQSYSRIINVHPLDDTSNDAIEMVDIGVIKLIPVIHSVSINIQGNGHVYPSGIVPVRHGRSQLFHISSEQCHQFEDVYLDNIQLTGMVTENTIELMTINMNHELTFIFTPIFYTITTSSNDLGTFWPPGHTNYVQCGKDQGFLMSPLSSTYYLKSIVVDSKIQNATDENYTFKNVQTNHHLHAEFASCYYRFLTEMTSFGSGGGNGTVTIEKPEACDPIIPELDSAWITIESITNNQNRYDVNYFVSETDTEDQRFGNFQIQNNSILSQHLISQTGKDVFHQHTIQLNQGWNLISVPFPITNTNCFPDAQIVFKFSEGAYKQAFTMYPGEGYWVKNTIQSEYQLVGSNTPSFSLEVQEGWHLIGANYAETSTFHSIPENMISAAYAYENGQYELIQNLKKGQGFWVKAVAPCVVVIE